MACGASAGLTAATPQSAWRQRGGRAYPPLLGGGAPEENTAPRGTRLIGVCPLQDMGPLQARPAVELPVISHVGQRDPDVSGRLLQCQKFGTDRKFRRSPPFCHGTSVIQH